MIYVTSDLHGCAPECLQQLLGKANFGSEDFLFVLGDVIDRGNHGVELLNWMSMQPNVQLMLGNHESLLLGCAFLFDTVTDSSIAKLDTSHLEMFQTWMLNGGNPTVTGLRNLKRQDPDAVDGILDYLREAPLYEEVSVGDADYLLVHAGLANFDPARPVNSYTADELLWARPSLDDRYFVDKTVIFGHTPSHYYGSEYQGRAVKTDTWLCIDTGAAGGGSPMLYCLDNKKEYYIE